MNVLKKWYSKIQGLRGARKLKVAAAEVETPKELCVEVS